MSFTTTHLNPIHQWPEGVVLLFPPAPAPPKPQTQHSKSITWVPESISGRELVLLFLPSSPPPKPQTPTFKTHSSHESWNQSISGRSTLLFLIENACGRCRLHSSCGLTCVGRPGFIIEKLTSVFCSGCCDDAKDFQVISFSNYIAECPVQWSCCYVLVVCIQHHQHWGCCIRHMMIPWHAAAAVQGQSAAGLLPLPSFVFTLTQQHLINPFQNIITCLTQNVTTTDSHWLFYNH